MGLDIWFKQDWAKLNETRLPGLDAEIDVLSEAVESLAGAVAALNASVTSLTARVEILETVLDPEGDRGYLSGYEAGYQ